MDAIKEAGFEDGERIEREMVETEDKGENTAYIEIIAFDTRKQTSTWIGTVDNAGFCEVWNAVNPLERKA